MRALILALALPAVLLIGCGKMETQETTAGNALTGLAAEGVISNEEAENINEDLLDETLEVSEVSSNSIMMKVGGAELLIDFIDQLSGNSDAIAMIINGIEVTNEVASNPNSLQGLIASLITSQLGGQDVLGVPLMDLVSMGLQLISGSAEAADFSDLFAVLIRGALQMYLGSSPIGAIVSVLVGPLLDHIFDSGKDANDTNGKQASGNQNQNNNGQNNNQNQNNNNDNNSGGGFLGTIVNTVGGLFGGGSSPLGGVFNLITNLFK